MKLPIEFICETCNQINQQECGQPNFKLITYHFYSLTDALQHIWNNSRHDVIAIASDEE